MGYIGKLDECAVSLEGIYATEEDIVAKVIVEVNVTRLAKYPFMARQVYETLCKEECVGEYDERYLLIHANALYEFLFRGDKTLVNDCYAQQLLRVVWDDLLSDEDCAYHGWILLAF